MGRVCTICGHPERDQLEQALVARAPYRRIAAQFGVTESALVRHKADHLPAHVQQAAAARELIEADTLLTQARMLYAKSIQLLRHAEAAGDIKTALAGVREARGNLELLGKLLGQIDSAPQVELNVYAMPEYLTIIRVLREQHPEAALAVAAALGEGNGHAHE